MLLTAGCEKDYSNLSSKNARQPLPVMVPLVVTPDSGTAGTRIKIFGMKFLPSAGQNEIYFEGVEPFRPDSGSADTLYSYTPFEASSGSIKVTYWGHDTIGVFPYFKFIAQCDTTAICVLPYDLNVVLTEQSALQVFPGWYDERAWSGEIRGDTVIISRQYEFLDSGVTRVIKFLYTDEHSLPQLVSSVFRNVNDTRTICDTLTVGIIKIQDWDTSGVVSGRVIDKVWGVHNYIFWYDFRN